VAKPKNMKHSLEISKADFELGRYKKDTEIHSKIRSRMQMIYLDYKRYSKTKIADILDVDYITIWRWSEIHKKRGLKGLTQLYYKGQANKLHNHKEEIKKEIDEVKPSTIEEIRQLIGIETGIWRCLTQVKAFVKKHLNISRRKVQPLPGGKMTLEELVASQKYFLTNKLNPLIKKALSEDIRLFFCDAVHPTHGFYQGYVYSSRPYYVRTGHGRYRFNMYSAVDAKNKDLFTIHGGKYVHAETVIELLDLLSERKIISCTEIMIKNLRFKLI
jgi:transposase